MKWEIEEWFTRFEEASSQQDKSLQEERWMILTELMNTILNNVKLATNEVSIIQTHFCSISTYYGLWSYTTVCWSDGESAWFPAISNDDKSEWGFPTRLKIVLIILFGWLLAMWWIILFFSIKAKLNSGEDEEW